MCFSCPLIVCECYYYCEYKTAHCCYLLCVFRNHFRPFQKTYLILHSVSHPSCVVMESLLVWTFRHIFGITIFFHKLYITEPVADCAYLYSYLCILARRLLSSIFCFKHLCLKSKSQKTLFNRSNSRYSTIFFNVSAFADSSD